MKNPITIEKAIETLKRMEGYYYYNNWVAGKENMIHKHDCGNAQYGAGMNRLKEPGVKGVWVGPFKTKKLANEKVFSLFGKDAAFHDCCN